MGSFLRAVAVISCVAACVASAKPLGGGGVAGEVLRELRDMRGEVQTIATAVGTEAASTETTAKNTGSIEEELMRCRRAQGHAAATGALMRLMAPQVFKIETCQRLNIHFLFTIHFVRRGYANLRSCAQLSGARWESRR